MTNKTILLISPEPWQWQYVSKHHYAITLAQKGYTVYFLNPPDNHLKNIEIRQTKYSNLYEVTAPQVAKGLRFYPKFLRVFVEGKWLNNFEKLIGAKISVVWLFENSRFYNMEFAKDRLKIYHQVDSNQDFHIKEAASSADICYCVTDYIRNDLLKYHKNVFKIPHGLSLPSAKKELTKEQQKKFLLSDINVGYIGNLDMKYIHVALMDKLISKYKDVMFHFVGSYSENGELYRTCHKYQNVIWWGRVESAMIPSILEKVDISLLCYKVEEFSEQLANSHKILEYLYSGKVTVATYTDEYKDKRHLLEMVDNSNDYLPKFDEVIANLQYYNSQDKQKKRKKYALENTYEKQLEKIMKILQQNNLSELLI